MLIPNSIRIVLDILNKNGFEGYLVGGCVRDTLMGIAPHDYDLTTDALPDEMLSIFSYMKIIETGLKHGTVTVVSDGENVEITTFRIDGDYADNRHPESVSFTRSLCEDLSRRDFTSNAIAYSPNTGYVDNFGGIGDIEDKIIRCVGDADKRFNEDGLRIIRALRFSSVLGFSIEKETADSIHRNKNLLKNISAERIYSELKKLLSGKNAYEVLKEYYDVFCVIFPRLSELETLYFENIKNLPASDDDAVLSFSALFFGMDKASVRESLRGLKPDNYLYNNARLLLEYSERDIGTDEVSVRYIMRDLDDGNIRRLCILKGMFCADFDKDGFWEEYQKQLSLGACVRLKDLKLTGADLIAIGIERGPEIGEIMNFLLSAVIENRCKNEKCELIRLAKER